MSMIDGEQNAFRAEGAKWETQLRMRPPNANEANKTQFTQISLEKLEPVCFYHAAVIE